MPAICSDHIAFQCLLDFQPSFCGVKGKEKTNGIHHSSKMVAEFNAANPTCSGLYFSLYHHLIT
ncbi:hypothetical protein IC582_030046 [Cucumis melo]